MGVALAIAHDETDVHQARRLRDLPVYPGRGDVVGDAARVDDEVAHAPEEVVLVDVPLCTSPSGDVRVRVCRDKQLVSRVGAGYYCARTNDGHATEVGCGEKCGWRSRIANELRVVVGSGGSTVSVGREASRQ